MPDRFHPDLVFAGIGASFGTVFVVVNAPALPPVPRLAVMALGVALLLAAVWRMGRRPWHDQDWDGPVRPYVIAVIAELIAIPVGALVLNHGFHQPRLVVLWVVFVAGAHFVPARSFGVGRYFQLAWC